MNRKDQKNRVAILGNPIINNHYHKATSEIFNQVGKNIGNQLFRFATYSHISSPKEIVDFNTDPEYLKNNFDILVIPSANQVNPAWDLGSRAKFIEQCQLPVLVIGLGAQASQTNFADKLELQPGTIRYLKIISEYSKRIAVRGEFTARCLQEHGIANIVVIGCPSIFLSPRSNLGEIIEPKYQKPIIKLSVASASCPPNKIHQLVERKLIDLVDLYRGHYICQAPQDLIALSRSRLEEIQQPNYLQKLHSYLMPRVSYPEFISFARRHFTSFWNVESWLEFLSTCDFSLGKRIHGNIAAIQAETPALVITHDSRTKELCNTLKIPNIAMTEFLTTNNLIDLSEKISFDGKEFDNNRIKLAEIYQSLFLENGINCDLPLLENHNLELGQKLVSVS